MGSPGTCQGIHWCSECWGGLSHRSAVPQGKVGDRLGFFPANFVQRVRPGESVWRSCRAVQGDKEQGRMSLRENQVGRGGPHQCLLLWGAPSWVRRQRGDATRAVPSCLSICLSVCPDLCRRGQDPGPRPGDQREEAGAGPCRGADRDLRGGGQHPAPTTTLVSPSPSWHHRLPWITTPQETPSGWYLTPPPPQALSHAGGGLSPMSPSHGGPAQGTCPAGTGQGTRGWPPPGWHCPRTGHPSAAPKPPRVQTRCARGGGGVCVRGSTGVQIPMCTRQCCSTRALQSRTRLYLCTNTHVCSSTRTCPARLLHARLAQAITAPPPVPGQHSDPLTGCSSPRS